MLDSGHAMTADQRWIVDLSEVLAVRVECSKCGTAVVIRPDEWHDPPLQCPGCSGLWDLPHVGDERSPLQHLGFGLQMLLKQAKNAAQRGSELPYAAKLEMRDQATSKYGA